MLFSHTSIAKRLMLLTGSLLAMLTIIGSIGIAGVSGTSSGLRTVYENNTVPLVRLGEVLDYLYHSRALVISGMQADSSSAADGFFKQIQKVDADLNEAWSSYQKTVVSAEGKSQADAFDQAWRAYAESGRKTVELATSGDYETAASLMKNESAQKFDAAREALLKLMRFEKDNAANAFAGTNSTNTVLTTTVLLTLAIGLAIGGWLSYAIIHSITGPLRLMQSTIGEVEETYDFTKRVAIDSEDEVGQTAKSFNELMAILQQSLTAIAGDVQRVSDAARQLSTSAGKVASSSEQESEDTAAMAATVQQVTTSVSHISDNAREAMEIANHSGKLSIEGGNIIHKAVADMTQIADSVRETARTIEDLGQQSERVTSIVQVIKDVADQTNLLALNAAIEAARAGEQGRGFAVVADEVRKLAERTTKATEEITQMIGAMQSSAQVAVSTMGTTMGQVDGGVTLAQQAGEAITQIRQGTQDVIKMVNDISAALVEQSSASNNMASRVENIALGTERNRNTASDSAQAARQMDELVASMRETVSRFRT
jgi:methyl-accepting chemotaxis protein